MAKSKGSKPSPSKATFFLSFTYPETSHPVSSFLAGLGDDSQRVTLAALESVSDILSGGKRSAHELAWHQLTHSELNALRGRLQQLYAPSTANRYLSAVRGVLRECWRLDFVDRDSFERAIDVKPIRGKRDLRGRAVSRRELVDVFDACSEDENQTMGVRDAAILALLYGVGLRRAEAAALELRNYKPGDGSLRITGKGNKVRLGYIPDGSLAALDAWLDVRGRRAGPLFSGITKGGRLTHRQITPQLIYRVVRKRHTEAGVAELTPHDLRRSHISDMLTEGADLAVVARQVGHSNVATTARYDRRDSVAQRSATSRLRVPFTNR